MEIDLREDFQWYAAWAATDMEVDTEDSTEARGQPPEEKPPKESEVVAMVKKELLKIHCNMNHMGKAAMRAYLKRKGALQWVIDLADEMQCSICEASARRNPIPVAAGNAAEPLDVVQCDGFD